MNYHLTLESSNAKTGPIPVSTTGAQSCPDNCRLKGFCYAQGGPLGMHWRKVTDGDRGTNWKEFLSSVSKIPLGSAWRHNQAGDLPGENNQIDAIKLAQLTEAQRGRRGWTYTHKPLTQSNSATIAGANANGFTVNLSADNIQHADLLYDNGCGPVVVIVPRGAEPVTYTPKGRKIVLCPAQYRDGITCKDCMLCQRAQRSVIIGFTAHGTYARKTESVCSNNKA